MHDTEEEKIERLMKRIEANDPVAMRHMGAEKYHKGDYKAAFEYWTMAAEMGDTLAHHNLSVMYQHGEGVKKDVKREVHHAEHAAIGGQPSSRCNLGCVEWKNGRVDRAAKHFIIAAKHGDDLSLGNVKNLYKAGVVSKDDFAAALRGHQAAIAATKSPQREEAVEFYNNR